MFCLICFFQTLDFSVAVVTLFSQSFSTHRIFRVQAYVQFFYKNVYVLTKIRNNLEHLKPSKPHENIEEIFETRQETTDIT